MSFSFCEACPIRLGSAILVLAIGAVVLFGGVALRNSRNGEGRALGAILLALSIIWYGVVTLVVPRWGIDWQPGKEPFEASEHIHPVLDRLMIYGWVLISVSASVVSWSRTRRRA